MANVTIEKKSYKVDPLYQWDRDQELFIYGLSLSTIPEIHFTNDAMDKAIVRQATVDARGVITVKIPNSLLQKPYKIRAYVCTYEGDTFKSLYLITIPMIPRNMPADYTLTVSDEEVYSFNELENKIESLIRENTEYRYDLMSEYAKESKALQDNVKALTENLNADVEETTKNLTTRVDNIIANASDTGNNAELIDIRVGVDGTVYTSAGEAVRDQIDNLKYFISNVTMDDVTLDQMWGMSYEVGDVIVLDHPESRVDYFTHAVKVQAGDVLVVGDTFEFKGYNDRLLVIDDTNNVVEVISYLDLNIDKTYAITKTGTLYMSSYRGMDHEVIFTIKRPNALQRPLILSAIKVEEYQNDAAIGDEALHAILTGRQILVRVPNADGGNYTAIYSPIYMYQLPNYQNDYLYLLYLNDGLVNGLPTYSQLKLKLSKVYNSTPLGEEV